MGVTLTGTPDVAGVVAEVLRADWWARIHCINIQEKGSDPLIQWYTFAIPSMEKPRPKRPYHGGIAIVVDFFCEFLLLTVLKYKQKL